ncbi:transcriptional activator Mut3p [Fusarium beomiforme]|uniref:Transcriptional activator Mut3p n=1 Tax=Fusarium beomiforme TaxID=44412 RepID=A0A9P5DS19_9HYPO|nr:transcriptional activator Mut3p [Fusarium beomiforme]
MNTHGDRRRRLAKGNLAEINVAASAPLRDANDIVQAHGATPPQPNPNAEARVDASTINISNSSTFHALDTTAACTEETVVGGTEDMRYFGPHSGVSLFSTAVRRESGQQPPESWSQWTHPSIEPVFKKRENRPLPSWTEAFSLASEFFRHEHQAFPCYNPPAFMSLLGQHYSRTCAVENPAWWAALNAVLAIAQRRRAEIAQSPEAEDTAWGYAANALDSCLDILMRSTQLLSVQAILTVAWFFTGTPNPQPSFMLIGCAVRLAHSIGLHSNSYDPLTNAVDMYMKKRVFWIAVCMDRDFCLRTGRPPSHDLQTFLVDAPTDSPDETEIVITAAGFNVNLFKAQSRLAIIQSSIHRELLPSKSSPAGITGHISSFMDELKEWSNEFAPSLLENLVQRHEHLGLTRLYLSYYNTVIITNRANSFNYWIPLNNLARSTLTPDIEVSIEHCLTASRSIIDLFQSVPETRRSFYWLNVPILLNAVLIICISILREPTPKTTETDLQSISSTLQLFKALDEPYGDTYLTQIRKMCHELYEKARQNNRPSEVQSRRPSQWVDFEGLVSACDSQGINSILELNLDTGDHAMPYSAPILWDIDLSLWPKLP